jgi:hypothetical protein
VLSLEIWQYKNPDQPMVIAASVKSIKYVSGHGDVMSRLKENGVKRWASLKSQE